MEALTVLWLAAAAGLARADAAPAAAAVLKMHGPESSVYLTLGEGGLLELREELADEDPDRAPRRERRIIPPAKMIRVFETAEQKGFFDLKKVYRRKTGDKDDVTRVLDITWKGRRHRVQTSGKPPPAFRAVLDQFKVLAPDWIQ